MITKSLGLKNDHGTAAFQFKSKASETISIHLLTWFNSNCSRIRLIINYTLESGNYMILTYRIPKRIRLRIVIINWPHTSEF